jgi:hypothetical protein
MVSFSIVFADRLESFDIAQDREPVERVLERLIAVSANPEMAIFG